ncbi:MAG: DNA internalization-related competence protein ComEC/Rec2 [Eubacteriales bacterium]|nr:DNA internalization-related competence protein ComEC/Rec2 [Eubacteriales bacterium]
MKRPLLSGAVIAVITALASNYIYKHWWGNLPAIISFHILYGCMITFSVYVFIKRRKLSITYMFVLLSMATVWVSSYKTGYKLSDVENYETEQSVTLSGKVVSVSRKENREVLMVSDSTIRKSGIVVYTSETGAVAGDYITVSGNVSAFEKPVNYGNFDTRSYYNSLGYQYKCVANKVNIDERDKEGLEYILSCFSGKIKEVYDNVYDEYKAGVVTSIVLGDKSYLDEDIKSMYQKNGIAHLLSISGLHISLVGMCMYRLLRKKTNRFNASIMSITVIICYLVMVGNVISATRAVIMLVMTIIADVLGRTYDILSALSLSCIFLLWDNSYVIYNTGFLMSFSAILGIIFIYPILSKKDRILLVIKRNNRENADFLSMIIYKALDSFACCLSIQLSTLPVVLNSSYQIPVISVVLNCLVIPLMTVVMVSGILTGLAGVISLQAAFFFAGASGYILDFYEFLCRISSDIPYAVIVTGKPSSWSVMLYVTVIVIWVFLNWCAENRNRKRDKSFATMISDIIMAAVLLLAIVVMRHIPYDGLSIDILNVGQGDGIFVQSTDGTSYLFDGGSLDVKNVGKYRILPFLKAKGIGCLDYIVVSHCDKDHISGIKEIIELSDNTFSIKCLVLPDIVNKEGEKSYIELVNLAVDKGVSVMYMTQGMSIDSKQLKVTCLHPCQGYKYEDSNDYSAIYKVWVDGFSMLMMGDAGEKTEKCLMEDIDEINNQDVVPVNTPFSIKNISVIKVGHHGSKSSTSQELLREITPMVSLISCGKDNSYGHPHKQTLERLCESGCKVFRTDSMGAISITVDVDKKIWNVKSMK